MSDEYPRISSSTGWVRIDFSGREFAQFRQRDGENPYFYAVGRGGGFADVQGLENNDIRRFAEEILRQFPETAPEPEPEYLVVVDGGGDEWVRVSGENDLYALMGAYTTRKEVAERRTEAWALDAIVRNYNVKAVATVTGEEAR